MGRIILSAFADEYDAVFEEQLKGIVSLGIGNIEIRGVDGKNISTLTKSEVKDVKSKLDCYGIGASAIGSPIGKVKLDEDLDAHLEMSKRVFETARELGTKYVRMFSFYAPEGKEMSECRSEAFSELSRLVSAAKEQGVVLCHENEANIYGDVPSRCREIFDNFGGDIKCVFDMGNFALDGIDPLSAYELLKDEIAYFHIKDALGAGAIVPPGKGEAKIAEILAKHVKYSNKDFFISLEPHLQLFSGLNALTHRSFDNPYKYNDMKEAFVDALTKLKELLPQ